MEDGQWYRSTLGDWMMWSSVSRAIWYMNQIDTLLKNVEFV